jgi:hypothetical protein
MMCGYSEGDAVGNAAAVKQLRDDLENKSFETVIESSGDVELVKLRQFEIASLLNMAIDDAEEAYALIPSLQRHIRKDDLQEVLETITKSRDRTAFA